MRNIIITILLGIGIALLLQGAGCQSSEFSTAKMAVQQKDYDKADQFLQKELAKNPNNAEAYSLLADIKTQKRLFVDAAKALAKANELAKAGKDKKQIEKIDFQILASWQIAYQNSITYYQNYVSDKKIENLDSAISLCEAGSIIRPTNVLFPSQWAYFLETKGDTVVAMQQYKRYSDIMQKEIDFAKEKEIILNMNRDEALAKIGGKIEKTRIDTLKVDKKDVGAYRYSDQIKLSNGKEVFLTSDKKKDETETKVKGWYYDPSSELRIEEKTMYNDISLEPYFIISQYHFDKKEYDVAIDYLKKITTIDPGNKTANASIIQLYEISGNASVAFEELEGLIKKNPENKLNYSQYGDMLYNMKKYDEAIMKYELAIKIDPEYDVVLFNLGAIYKNKASLKQQEQQEKKLNSTKYQVNPEEYFPQLKKAADYFSKALNTKKFKDNFEVLAELSNIYTIIGDEPKLNETIANLEKIEYTLPKAQKERYFLQMINIFSFKKDEAKTQKYQAKYEKISNTKE